MAFLSGRYDFLRRKALSYTDGFDQQHFVASGLNYDATVRNLELIGEAARANVNSTTECAVESG
jgi:uncharacterized protein with HEPN domain